MTLNGQATKSVKIQRLKYISISVYFTNIFKYLFGFYLIIQHFNQHISETVLCINIGRLRIKRGMAEEDLAGLESLSSSQKDVQFRNKYRRIIKANCLAKVYLEKWLIKMELMCVISAAELKAKY